MSLVEGVFVMFALFHFLLLHLVFIGFLWMKEAPELQSPKSLSGKGRTVYVLPICPFSLAGAMDEALRITRNSSCFSWPSYRHLETNLLEH